MPKDINRLKDEQILVKWRVKFEMAKSSDKNFIILGLVIFIFAVAILKLTWKPKY